MSFGTHITKYALFGLFLLLDGIVLATVPTTVISVYLCYLASSTASVLAIVHFGSVGRLWGLFERSKAT